MYQIVRTTQLPGVGEQIHAVLDSPDDLATLGNGYPAGSTAIVAAKDGPIYMVNASGQWEEL